LEAVVTRAIRRFLLLAACLGVTALAGCTAGTQPVAAASGSTQPAATAGGQPSVTTSQPVPPPSAMPVPADMNVAAFKALAMQEAAAWPLSPLGQAWKTGLVIPSTAYLTEVGNPRGFPSDAVREAFGNGNLVYTGPPPTRYGPAAVVRFLQPAASMKVPVLTEAQTFDALKNNTVVGRCPDCQTTPLAVTNVQPNTLDVPTNRGHALVPAWSFIIPALDAAVDQAALPPGSYVTEMPLRGPAEDLGPLGKAFVGADEAHVLTPDGRTLGMWLAGIPCRPPATYGALVAEVGDVVVIGGWIHDPQPVTDYCAASGYVTIRLAKPLGDRVILDAQTGVPAPYPFHPGPGVMR
jgi:hypothetical protein